MSSSRESTPNTSAGCEPPTRHDFGSISLDCLIDEIDKFLNEYTSDGNELPSNTNTTESFEELNGEVSGINANDLVSTQNIKYKNKTISKEKLSEELPSITPVLTSEEIKSIYNVNKKPSSEPNDIKYVGKNAAVFQLLEENENFGVYEYIPNVNNWNVFYKPLPDDQQIQYVKKEPGTDYINNLSNLPFSQYPIIKLEPESIEANNQNQNSVDINQNDLNEISQIWNQPEMNIQQKNINQALQIQNFKNRIENIKIPIENPDNSTKYTVCNNDHVKNNIIPSAGTRWNHNYKQNNYSDAGNIPPKFKNKKKKNNYNQSDGYYRSTYSKQNVFKNNFKRPFYKTPQENYSSSTHELSGFNSHTNRFHFNKTIQKPNKILQGINQFGPHMPFKRNNKEWNKYNEISNSQNETISQYKSNVNDKYFNNFQLPFIPPTNEVNEPYQDFSEPQLSLNQPDLNYGIQNQFSEDSRFGYRHEQNLYMKNNVSVLPNWSDSYDHLNNNNMEIQNRKENNSYNQYLIHNNFKVQNVGGNDPLNPLSTNQNIQIEKSDEHEPYNQYSTNNSSEIHINGRNNPSNQYLTNNSFKVQYVGGNDQLNPLSNNQNVEIEKSDEYEPYNQYSTNISSEIQITGKNDQSDRFSINQSIKMQKSSTNATYNHNLKNKHFKIQNTGKNEPFNQYLNQKNIEMQKNGENQPYNQNATQKNIEKGKNDEKSHLSLSTTKNSNKKKIRIGIEEYKYYANNKKNIDVKMHTSMQVEPYNNNSTKKNEKRKTMGVEPHKEYSINKNVKMQKSGGDESCNHFSTRKSIEITPNNETGVTLVDGKESLNRDGCKYTSVMSLQESHYLIKDYLSPESLVGCTIKLSSRKLANAEIRRRLYAAFAVHGALSNSWWTSDDMFFVTYFERNVALGVYDMYPINTSSSY